MCLHIWAGIYLGCQEQLLIQAVDGFRLQKNILRIVASLRVQHLCSTEGTPSFQHEGLLVPWHNFQDQWLSINPVTELEVEREYQKLILSTTHCIMLFPP